MMLQQGGSRELQNHVMTLCGFLFPLKCFYITHYLNSCYYEKTVNGAAVNTVKTKQHFKAIFSHHID